MYSWPLYYGNLMATWPRRPRRPLSLQNAEPHKHYLFKKYSLQQSKESKTKIIFAHYDFGGSQGLLSCDHVWDNCVDVRLHFLVYMITAKRSSIWYLTCYN